MLSDTRYYSRYLVNKTDKKISSIKELMLQWAGEAIKSEKQIHNMLESNESYDKSKGGLAERQ